jgi:hypothetical protein
MKKCSWKKFIGRSPYLKMLLLIEESSVLYYERVSGNLPTSLPLYSNGSSRSICEGFSRVRENTDSSSVDCLLILLE